MPIAALPPEPSPLDTRPVFISKAFAWVAAFVTFRVEANALEANVVAKEISTVSNASAAAAAAGNAIAAGTATLWAAVNNYGPGVAVISPTDTRVYRRRGAGGVDATDPAADATRTKWEPQNRDLKTVDVPTTAVTLLSGQLASLTNAAATTVTFPASAVIDDLCAVMPTNGLLSNVINWNGLKHHGSSVTTTIIDKPGVHIFKYISAAQGWRAMK